MLPVGLAGPLIMPPITAVLLNSVPDAIAGTASGVFNTSRQLGGALAIAVFGALLAQPAGLAHGLRLSLAIAAAVALAAACQPAPHHSSHKHAEQAPTRPLDHRRPAQPRKRPRIGVTKTESKDKGQQANPPGDHRRVTPVRLR